MYSSSSLTTSAGHSDKTGVGAEVACLKIDSSRTARSSGPSTLKHTVSTQLAGAVSTLAFYPFDTLRVRFMSQDGTAQRQHNGQTYRSVGRALALVYREEGLSVLFRGCHVAVLGSVTAWGVYMFIYRSLCGLCSVSFADQACFALIASVVSTILSSPIWLIKSRMQIEDASGVRRYRTFSAGCRHVLQTTGVRSMWRGVSLQLLLVVPNALSFPLYDRMKEALLRRRSDSTVVPVVAHNGLSVADACLCSAVTKGLLVTVSHPIMLLKVRMQDQRWNVGDVQYATVRHSLPLIIKREGVRGIVRGLVPSLMYAVPRGVAHFVLYEKLLALLCRGS